MRAKKISLHIAGPLYRFIVTLQQVRSGEAPEQIRLRRGDEFQNLLNEFNNLLSWLGRHPPQRGDVIQDCDFIDDDEPVMSTPTIVETVTSSTEVGSK